MMSMDRPRRLVSFESYDGAFTYTFPRYEHEWASSQDLRVAWERVAGGSYAYDMQGLLSAPKDPAEETVQFVIAGDSGTAVDQQLNTLRSILYRAGRGRLWSQDSAGARYWAWARANNLADFELRKQNFRYVPVSVSFVRLSDWYGAVEQVVSATVTTTPAEVIVNNPGPGVVQNATITLKANGANGYVSPRVDNNTTGEWFQIARTAANGNHQLRVDTGRYTVDASTDNGASWTSAYDSFTQGGLSVGFMRLEAGANTLTITNTNTPNLTFEIRFYPVYD